MSSSTVRPVQTALCRDRPVGLRNLEKVWRTCEGAEIRGRTVTLKVKYADFQQITRSRTGQALFSTRAEIEQLSYALLGPLFPVTKGIRLLGMTLSSLGGKQLESEPQLRLLF